MKIQRNKSKKRLVAIVSFFLALLILFILSGYLYFNGLIFSKSDKPKIDLTAPTAQQQNVGNDIKKQALEKNKLSGEIKKNISITITSSVQNGGVLQIRSLITPLIGSGLCNLELTRGVNRVIRESNIQAQASSSSCQGFDIPITELEAGVWNIHLTVSTDNESGETKSAVEIK